jgi:hypothetical protein
MGNGLLIKDIKTNREGDNTSSSILFDQVSKHTLEYHKNKQEVDQMIKDLFGDKQEQKQEKVHTIQEIIAQLPEGAEFIELCIDGEETITKAMLDEERADKNMRISSNKEKRSFTTIYRHNSIEFTIADDGTAWFLDRENKENPVWLQMFEAGYPELPQD